MMHTRDILDLAAKQVGGPPTTLDPALWEEIGLPFDFHPWIGWNVADPRRVSAVGLGLAIQCAAVKARDIAKSGMTLWRRNERRWEAVLPKEHWFAKLLARRPNGLHSWGEFWRMTVLHLELAQNAYILKQINNRGEVIELLPIQPARVRQRISTAGRLFYEIHAATEFERAQVGEDIVIVPANRVIHLRGKMLDGMMGLSNAALGHPVFELLGAINAYQTSLFGNDGKQPLVFETDATFTGEQADAAFRRLKEQLREAARKARATGEAILLEGGLKAKSIAVNSRDAMTTEAYKQQVERICGLMECPPHKIFHYGDGAKYDNQAAADNQYAADCLIPIADNIEEKFRNELLDEEEWDAFWPEFDRERMTASDAKAMNERIKVAVMSGTMMLNEARERWGLNPTEGGNVFLIPVNMAIVNEAGEIVGQAATGQNAGAGRDEDDEEQAAERRGLPLAVDNK